MKNEISDSWYEDFFKGINCEIWEKAIPIDLTLQEVDFLLSELNLQPGQSILDIPCGNGRHAIELAKRGYHVTGVDISEKFISSLSDKINSSGLDIKVIQADILSVRLNTSFSAAICMGNSFGYFSIEKMSLFVEKVSACLMPGSKFIINSGMVAESILPNFLNYAQNKSYTVDTISMEVTNTYFADEGYMTSDLLYKKEGRSEEHSFKHYVFTLGEVIRLLQLHGLRTIATYSSTTKTNFKLGDRQVYIVAEKEG
ncbi:Cyclopropane fatty-acyl-phospholipid synthase [Algoriphagus alkaliphilus]|uniref:Cyclopropane fatty-acyl-phospholipid synthase n=1 Tax=Algoriphagus alkaliphilus TaxID=279824 RepID=A0A1G5XG57_9BACT|nr:class I SAM-dependent methyltransferase [Algoriphagus alkaliphilus]MBA4299777.1 class I SAM-dependent methyltransferase [Cyclobacterium sp.]SDA68926.1 Cyclopropane fatty-acyl-phospholipid synthase [Algoriphagus alkaliphilus]